MNPFRRVVREAPIAYFIAVGIRCCILFKDIVELRDEWLEQILS